MIVFNPQSFKILMVIKLLILCANGSLKISQKASLGHHKLYIESTLQNQYNQKIEQFKLNQFRCELKLQLYLLLKKGNVSLCVCVCSLQEFKLLDISRQNLAWRWSSRAGRFFRVFQPSTATPRYRVDKGVWGASGASGLHFGKNFSCKAPCPSGAVVTHIERQFIKSKLQYMSGWTPPTLTWDLRGAKRVPGGVLVHQLSVFVDTL